MQRPAPIPVGDVRGRKKERDGSEFVSESPRPFLMLFAALCVPAALFAPAVLYRTRSVRPMRSVVVDLMPLRRQMLFTVVP